MTAMHSDITRDMASTATETGRLRYCMREAWPLKRRQLAVEGVESAVVESMGRFAELDRLDEYNVMFRRARSDCQGSVWTSMCPCQPKGKVERVLCLALDDQQDTCLFTRPASGAYHQVMSLKRV